ncbi:MAG: 3-isopropylmalate dehydratase small subunit [Promethearchaeota archaeon]|nr:MAG: 3-isopropylmalate dehydratase small subunit [Candidatus Lokiarchaeota archaeon]
MNGIVLKYEEKNINTDLIIPARFLNKSDFDHLAEHCMEDLDPNFHKRKQDLNASILVGGANFGSGSSREQAPISLKAAGIKCIIAPYFARIFFRNSINIGLPIIEFVDISQFSTGDQIEISLVKGFIRNITTDKEFSIKKMPPFLREIISADGLINYARSKIIEI